MKSIVKRHVVGLALGLLVVAASPASRADISYYVNQSGSVDYDGRDIDFTSPSIDTNSSGVTAGLKMRKLELATNNGQSQCLEIRTSGDGTGDTRLWIYSGSDYTSLNDDANGGLYSMARVWLVPAAGSYEYANVYVTGYSSGYNSMKFSLDIYKLSGITTEAGCTSGATFKSIQGVQTTVNAS